MDRFSIRCLLPRKVTRSAVLALCALCLAIPSQSLAQNKKTFETKAHAADSRTLNAGQNTVTLWGVETVETTGVQFKLKARTALDNLIGGQKINCEVIDRRASFIKAQCVNSKGMDLSLAMLQQGHVIVDRSVVYGSVFEDPYISAETYAQTKEVGIWAASGTAAGGQSSGVSDLMVAILMLLLFLTGSLAAVSMMMMRGFKKVVEAQDRNTDFLSQERKLKAKERKIVASMLESELKGNKSKIEAYLVIYEEMLRSIQESGEGSAYKNSGDIVQLQPALDRSVFDGNTDKIDLLGRRFSSTVIHFYARIKTNPDYINLEPEMSLEEALGHIKKSVENAKRLDEILDKILDTFAEAGVS